MFSVNGVPAPIAQLVEHSTVNRKVESSNLSWGVLFFFLFTTGTKMNYWVLRLSRITLSIRN